MNRSKQKLVFSTNYEGGKLKPAWLYLHSSPEQAAKMFRQVNLKCIVLFWDGLVYDGFLPVEEFPNRTRGGWEYKVVYNELVKHMIERSS